MLKKIDSNKKEFANIRFLNGGGIISDMEAYFGIIEERMIDKLEYFVRSKLLYYIDLSWYETKIVYLYKNNQRVLNSFNLK